MPKKPSKPAKSPSKTTLNAQNLAAMGAERLAALLMDLADGDAALKRRLRLELAGTASPKEAAREIRKRLGQLARSRTFVERHQMRALASDLETQRRAILEVGKSDPTDALDLMWQLMGLAGSVHDRSDDSDGRVGDVFRTACQDLAPLAVAAKPDPAVLAERVYEARLDNGYGQFDGLIEALAPILGPKGLAHLKQRFEALAKVPPPQLAEKDRRAIGWGMGGALYADEMETRARASAIRLGLQEIADAEGDVDAFIAQYDAAARMKPGIAAEIAIRLVAAGRAEEALGYVLSPDYNEGGWPHFDFEDARITVHEAVGDRGAAQATRWSVFERALSIDHLRAFLGKLPDFEDQDALERAFAHAAGHPSVLQALSFFTSWPAPDRAARLVLARLEEIDGNHYEVLSPAADALAARYPLAATLLLRSMIDFTLGKARASRYGHAARHLMDGQGLAGTVPDWGAFEPHEAYVSRLKREHARKSGFWGAVEAA